MTRTATFGPFALVETIGEGGMGVEFVDGQTLSEAVGDWQWPEVEDFLLGLLDALAHAHANDVIHRDLKPSNMLIVAGEADAERGVKLLDFGIADLCDDIDGGADDDRIRHIAALNLAMVDLGAGRLEEAQQRFTRLESTMRQAGLPSRLLRVYLGLAGCAAGRQNWQLWDRAIARVDQQLADNQDRNTDDPWLAELAADHAAEAGEDERAEQMYAITRQIWHDLDEPERAEELRI